MNVVDLNVIEFRNNGVIDSLTHAPAPAIFLSNLEREFARAKRLAHPELSTHSQTESKWTDSHISIISLRWEPPKIIESADCEYIEAQMVAMARSIVKLLRGDEFVARLQQLLEYDELRGVTRCGRQRRRTAFQCGNALFEHGGRGIGDAGVDVAERLQAEQRGGVVGVVEHERRGLIDRRRARAGGGIGLGAGMDRKRGESRVAVGHGRSLI